jgi:uncharacterized membrane protein YfcA
MILTLEPASWAILLLTGCALGVGFGLFGPLAGLATTPALLIALPYCGLPDAVTPKIAVATAVAILAPLSIAQVEAKIARRFVDWDLFALLASAAAVGAMLVVTASDSFDDRFWMATAVAGVIALATRALFAPASTSSAVAEPSCFLMTLKAITAGAAGAITGVSQTVLMAPALTKAPQDKGPGTAAALTLPFALAASGSYLFSEAPSTCGAACAGHVFLPASAAIPMAVVLIAPLAARLKPFIPARSGARTFAAALIISTLYAAANSGALSSLWQDSQSAAAGLLYEALCAPPPTPARPDFQEDPLHQFADAPNAANAR